MIKRKSYFIIRKYYDKKQNYYDIKQVSVIFSKQSNKTLTAFHIFGPNTFQMKLVRFDIRYACALLIFIETSEGSIMVWHEDFVVGAAGFDLFEVFLIFHVIRTKYATGT